MAGPAARLPPAAISPPRPVLDVSPAARRPLHRLPAPRLPAARLSGRQAASGPRAPRLRGGPPCATMKVEAGDNSMINLSVQQVLSLWAHGTVLRNLTGERDGPPGCGEGRMPSLPACSSRPRVCGWGWLSGRVELSSGAERGVPTCFSALGLR